MSESTNCQLPGSTNSLSSQPVTTTSRNKLKINQWNADGIRPKFIELRDLLLNSYIDVLAVQKSKLRKTDKTQKRSKQHPWRWSSILHPNGHRVQETTLFRKSWHGDPVYSYEGY